MTDSVRRVAITGAAGYVAGRLIERLERDSSIEGILATDIRPLDRQHSPKVIFRQHDVTTPMADLFSEHSIEAVVHLAYVLNPGHNRAASERVNVGGTINVLDACGQVGVQQIVYLSSTSVYGAQWTEIAFCETSLRADIPLQRMQIDSFKRCCTEDMIYEGIDHFGPIAFAPVVAVTDHDPQFSLPTAHIDVVVHAVADMFTL